MLMVRVRNHGAVIPKRTFETIFTPLTQLARHPDTNAGPKGQSKEWHNKAGFTSYSSMGGARAVEHLRLMMVAEVQVAAVRKQVTLSLFTAFENFSTFKPAAIHEQAVNNMLDQLVHWTNMLKIVLRQ